MSASGLRFNFKVGDRVKWTGTTDNGHKGTVTHVLGKRIEVTWDDDGEAYSYELWAGLSIRRA